MEEITSQMTFTDLRSKQFVFHQEIYDDLLNHVRVSFRDTCDETLFGV